MNQTDLEYNRLLSLVISEGRRKKNRTGTDTFGVFGAQARFPLDKGFPLLTTKKVFFKGIVRELLWFLSGSTNIKYLVDNDVHIWDDNAFANYQKKSAGSDTAYLNKEDYINAIKRADPNITGDYFFLNTAADLGEGTYGGMWRGFPFHDRNQQAFYERHNIQISIENPHPEIPFITRSEYEDDVDGYIDQISKVIDTLKNNPDDRRMIVSAWHPYWVDHCALPPCHVLFHFNTEELTLEERKQLFLNDWKGYTNEEECKRWMKHPNEQEIHEFLDVLPYPRRRLNCLLYQRSCDLFLGVPFNIASYALLTHMVAHVVNMVPGTFIHSYGDLHLYENHIEQAKIQLARDSYPAPRLQLNSAITNIFDFKFSDITLENYESHPTLKAEMAV